MTLPVQIAEWFMRPPGKYGVQPSSGRHGVVPAACPPVVDSTLFVIDAIAGFDAGLGRASGPPESDRRADGSNSRACAAHHASQEAFGTLNTTRRNSRGLEARRTSMANESVSSRMSPISPIVFGACARRASNASEESSIRESCPG